MANMDVCQGGALSGTNHSRCVKTERRRKAVTWWPHAWSPREIV